MAERGEITAAGAGPDAGRRGRHPCPRPGAAPHSSPPVRGQDGRQRTLVTGDGAPDDPGGGSHPEVTSTVTGGAGEPIAEAMPGRRPAPIETEALARLLAHELRTPLHVLRGFTEILLSGDAGGMPADVATALCEIAGASRLLDTTLAALGDLAAIAAPRRADCRVAADLGVELRRAGFELDAASTGLRCTILSNPSLLETGLRAARRWLERGPGSGASSIARLRLTGDGSFRAILSGTRQGRQVADLGGLDRLLASAAMAELGGRLSDQDLDLILDWPPEPAQRPSHFGRPSELCA